MARNDCNKIQKLTEDQVLEIFFSKQKRKRILSDIFVKHRVWVKLDEISAIKTGRKYSEITGKDYETPEPKLGEDNGSSKLTNADVLEIFNDPGIRWEIAFDFGISEGTVNNIKTGKSWSHITGKKYVKKY